MVSSTVAHKCTLNSKLHSQLLTSLRILEPYSEFLNLTPNLKNSLQINKNSLQIKKLTPN